jgi:hypothetical protein
MKVVKASSGKTKITLSKKEWTNIGKKAGWIKTAYFNEFNEIEQKISGVKEKIDFILSQLKFRLNDIHEIQKIFDDNYIWVFDNDEVSAAYYKELEKCDEDTDSQLAELNVTLSKLNQMHKYWNDPSRDEEIESLKNKVTTHLKGK